MPVIIELRVGEDVELTYAELIITPCSASRSIFGVSNIWFRGYTSSPKLSELSAQPMSSIRNNTTFGRSSVEQLTSGTARAAAERALSEVFMVVRLVLSALIYLTAVDKGLSDSMLIYILKFIAKAYSASDSGNLESLKTL